MPANLGGGHKIRQSAFDSAQLKLYHDENIYF